MDLRKELDQVSKELIRLENLQAKAEDDGNYDADLYEQIEKLESRRLELENQIDEEND